MTLSDFKKQAIHKPYQYGYNSKKCAGEYWWWYFDGIHFSINEFTQDGVMYENFIVNNKKVDKLKFEKQLENKKFEFLS
jgi:hypothetical protein